MSKKRKAKVRVSFAKWDAPPKSVRDHLPAHFFLLPDERKFPYKNWKGPSEGAINCNALRVAIARASQHGYSKVKKKAMMLYQRYCAKKE